MMPDDLLWKYVGTSNAGVARTEFLNDRLFRISQPSALNDPFEMKPRVLLDSYSEEDWRVARARAQRELSAVPPDDEIESMFLASAPALRFDEKGFPGLWPARIPELREEPFKTAAEVDEFRARQVCAAVERALDDNLGVFSLGEDPAQLLMWAHYGAQHRGVAVGFDRGNSFFRERGALLQVEYRSDRISVSSNGGMIRVAGEELAGGAAVPAVTLTRKHPDWAYEREWRFVVRLADATETAGKDAEGRAVHLLRFPAATVNALIFGALMDHATRAGLIDRIQRDEGWRHLRLYQARLSAAEFALQLEAIPVV
jgi:hypothetical protein